MPVYKCPRCDYITNNTPLMTKHITRNICKNSVKQIIEIKVEKIEEYVIENPYKCDSCTKTFSSKSNLDKHKHKKNSCKNKQELVVVQNPTEIQNPTTVNNTIINNNNIVVNIVLPHNKSDISYLTNADYYNILGRNLMSIPKMIEKIHFNEDKPQNQNIYIPNIKNKYAMVYNGTEWTLQNRDTAIHDLIVDNETRLEDWLVQDNVTDNYPTAMKRFETYLTLKEKDENLAMIKEEILLLLYNKRNLIIKKCQKL